MTERLKNAVLHPSHAYILVGKDLKYDANTFAKALQCEGRAAEESMPCGGCLSCRIFDSGNHPDVFFVKATKTKAIGVDDVRAQIIVPMSEKPFRYKYKVFIVDNVLTPAAQNALLKTIEEPASFGMFIFLTDRIESLLDTVISRSVMIRVGTEASAKKADNVEELQQLAELTARTIYGMKVPEVFNVFVQFESCKESIQILLDMLYTCYHGKLQTTSNLQADLLSLEAIGLAKKDLQYNGNFQMTIELMLLKMAGVSVIQKRS